MKFFEYGFLGIGIVGSICSLYYIFNFNSIEHISGSLIYLGMMSVGSIFSLLMFLNERKETKRLYGDINARNF